MGASESGSDGVDDNDRKSLDEDGQGGRTLGQQTALLKLGKAGTKFEMVRQSLLAYCMVSHFMSPYVHSRHLAALFALPIGSTYRWALSDGRYRYYRTVHETAETAMLLRVEGGECVAWT